MGSDHSKLLKLNVINSYDALNFVLMRPFRRAKDDLGGPHLLGRIVPVIKSRFRYQNALINSRDTAIFRGKVCCSVAYDGATPIGSARAS